MKVLIFTVALAVCHQVAIAQVGGPPKVPSMDSCCTGFGASDGFSQDVRLDDGSPLENPGAVYLKERGIIEQAYVNDYTGSLGSPGTLFQEINFSSYDLLSANATFTDKNNVQKLVVSPFRMTSKVNNIILNQFRINLAVKGDITTAGIGIGYDSSDPRRAEVKAKRKAIFDTGKFCIPECSSNKIGQEKIRQQNKRQANNLLIAYNTERTKNVFKTTVGYNAQLFSILSSSGTNSSANNTNYHAIKANSLSFSASYGHNNSDIQLNAGYNLIFSRKSAEKAQEMLRYNGVQAGVSFRVLRFLSPNKLAENDTYLKSFFVPALHVGVLYEYKGTDEISNVLFLENGLKASHVFTPFVDILISPAAQFRIGIPYTKSIGLITGTEDVAQFGTVLQYAFKLVNLN